jgi:hypothetical protein
VHTPLTPAAQPRFIPYPDAAAALRTLLDDPGGVIAFGELHQTNQTAGVKSAIASFTDELLPLVAPHASHLIVETWVATGKCGEQEAEVTKDVARTTERPPETENEIVRLLRKAKEAGVAPHVLDIGCEEYAALTSGTAGSVDYDRLLAMTKQHLERAAKQALLLPRPAERPLVVIYGGALHNDLYPPRELARYSFGPAVNVFARGAYREVDLYVPEYAAATPAIRAERWYRAWNAKRACRASACLIARSPRSAIIVFPPGTRSPRR